MENNNAGNWRKMTEGYNAFYPSKLPIQQGLDITSLYSLVSEADKSIGVLNGIESMIPNINLIIRKYAEKESLLSSQIEGTQSSLVELMLAANKSHKSVDIIEVENYFKALNHGIKRLKEDDFPFCLRLIKEIHQILMTGVRGGEAQNTPGEFRKSQNWIGGSKPSTASFVPPPPQEVIDLMGNLEKYLHDDDLPPLVKCALIHYQFETIHPFCDGNGRTGRIMITLYLIWKNWISSPILYLSLYFKSNRDKYYEYLNAPRKIGDFNSWIKYFLEGVVITAKQIKETTERIIQLQNENIKKAEILKSKYAVSLQHFLIEKPIITATETADRFKITHKAAMKLINEFVDSGILEQISEGNRNKKYIYRQYIYILEEGTENYK